MTNEPKKQHHLPQWYQRRFGTPNSRRVHTFNRKAGRELLTLSTANVGFEKDFYTLKLVTADQAYHIEKDALRDAEPNGAELLARIAAQGMVLTADVPVLRELMSLMHMRTKVYRDQCERAVRHGWSQLPIDANELVLPDGTPVHEPAQPDHDQRREQTVMLQMGRLPALLKVLEPGNWTYHLIQRPDDCFVTSDDPVIARSRHDNELGRIGLRNAHQVWFPIDPQRVVVTASDFRSAATLNAVDNALIRQFNTAIALASDTWVIWKPGSVARTLVDLPTT